MTEIKLYSPQAIVAEWLAHLEANGYRPTAPRRAVVEIIALSQHVLTPLDIFEQARPNHSRLGLVTVYRTLEKLEELELVQRVHQPSGCQAFIAAFSGHQHMLICQGCGRVEFFSGEDDKVETLMSHVGEACGYQVQSHWLQLFGICEHCQGDNAT
jgi:Fur family transcriptional regulator, ferric uptake regulator